MSRCLGDFNLFSEIKPVKSGGFDIFFGSLTILAERKGGTTPLGSSRWCYVSYKGQTSMRSPELALSPPCRRAVDLGCEPCRVYTQFHPYSPIFTQKTDI